MSAALHILLVEDNPTDALLTEEALSTSRFQVLGSQRLGDALGLLVAKHFDVVLLDLGLPDSQGLDTLRALRGKNAQVAIVVLTGKDDEELALQALNEGAQDYLVKGDLHPRSLQRAIRYAVERTASDALLRKSEQRARELTAHIHQVLWMIDAKEARALYVSPAYEAIWGRSCQALLDNLHSYLEGIHPLDQEMMRREDAAMYQTGHIDVECRVLRPDGSMRWVWIRGYPVTEQGEIVRVAGVIEDVTEKRRLAVEREALEEQFRQAQKMEAVGSLAAGVAHDFNNLLTIINGYSEIIHTRLPADSSLKALVREIGQAGERAASLTRQLLAFSRKQVLEPKVLNLNAIVTDTAKMLQRLIGDDVDLDTILAPTLAQIKADPGQIEQVIINLAVNARDAMPQGGKLTIETANTVLDESYVQAYPELRPGPYVLLALADAGTGMDDATKARIFEPFFTTKAPGKGTGLGLAMVFGIVKQSEGHIAVYSERGRGTTFKVYLPAIKELAATGLLPSRRQGDVAHGTETVLLTEDEPAMRALARHVLSMHGYTVLEAGNGDKALRVAEAHQEPIHLLVTDVVMPGMSGRQLAERLVLLRPGIKVLYVSGYTDDAMIRHGVLQAETAFLQKPFTPGAFAHKVREVLDG